MKHTALKRCLVRKPTQNRNGVHQILLRADEFVIDLKAKTGRRQRNNERRTLSRKVKGAVGR